jgi:hypothetical protein
MDKKTMNQCEERLKLELQQYEHYRFRLFLGSNIFCFLSGMYLHYLINDTSSGNFCL